jgi:hypothetical protein
MCKIFKVMPMLVKLFVFISLLFSGFVGTIYVSAATTDHLENGSSSSSKKSREIEVIELAVIQQEAPSNIRNPTTLTALCRDLMYSVSSYLDCFDVILLSHTTRSIRKIFSEDYWAKELNGEKYLIWDESCPKLKVYLANHYYKKGFSMDPSIPEVVALQRKDIIPIPPSKMKYAHKTLTLGFPKGQKMFDQAMHLLRMKEKEMPKKKSIGIEKSTLIEPLFFLKILDPNTCCPFITY